MSELLLTVEQAAERLQVRPVTVRDYLKKGRLRGIKRGKLWRVPESALLEPDAPNGNGTSTNGTARSEATREARRILAGLDSRDMAKRNAAIIALAHTDAQTRELVKQEVSRFVAAHPLPPDELADWRALQGEPFHALDREERKDREEEKKLSTQKTL